jgi:hypothetical protein
LKNNKKSVKRLKQFLVHDNACIFKLEENVILENALDKDFDHHVNVGYLELVIGNSADEGGSNGQQSSRVQ